MLLLKIFCVKINKTLDAKQKQKDKALLYSKIVLLYMISFLLNYNMIKKYVILLHEFL